MTQQNSFINSGGRRAEKAISEWAKRELASIESSDISADEKQKEIKRIENERDEKLKRVSDPQILWAKN